MRKVRKGSRNARPQLVDKGSQQQLVDAVSTLSLTGLGWADGSKAIYDTAKAVVGTERRKARYWVYDNVGEVDQIIAVRKAAGNTKEACDKARRDFAALKDAWWNDCASRLQRAAENGDTKVVHQLLREVYGPTQRNAIAFPMPSKCTLGRFCTRLGTLILISSYHVSHSDMCMKPLTTLSHEKK